MARRSALGARLVKIGLVLLVPTVTLVVAEQSVLAATPHKHTSRVEGFSCPMTRAGEYQKADPAAAGLDPAKLQRALAYAERQDSLSIKV
ncbi:MAG: hypothetical protein ACRD1G_04420, partial [Acidimicrobiales bacterium]